MSSPQLDEQEAFKRPPSKQLYERLDDYFRGHNLDALVVDVPALPTNVDLPVLPSSPAASMDNRSRHSIRSIANGYYERNRSSSITDSMQVQSTVLWGSQVEEITHDPGNGMVASDGSGPSESSIASPYPKFQWVRGELIGKGTYGCVYLALNTTLGEMMAVKQVEKSHMDRRGGDQRGLSVIEALRSESEVLRDLNHPHVVRCLGLEETTSIFSIFFEYVSGGSIGTCISKHGKFSETVTKSFTTQILNGLAYLHSKGITHGDIKSDNILVDPSGTSKISGVEILKRTIGANEGTAFATMRGTVFWMAPEVVRAGPRGCTSKIDIWSLGCVVLEMWSGQRPWHDQESFAVMFKLYAADAIPPIPDGVQLSILAEEFYLKCVSPEPMERATAVSLCSHPYLVLPPSWSFNGILTA